MAELLDPLSSDRRHRLLRERGDLSMRGDRWDHSDGNGHDLDEHEEPISNLLKEALSETSELVKSEIQVLKLEVQESARAVVRDSLMVAVFAGMALLGVFCLVAFMVIGLGALISQAFPTVNGYWISALAIGLLFIGVGGGLAYKFSKRIGKDVSLKETQAELERDRQLIKTERRIFTEAVRP